jgi:hypothetical protein
VTNPAEAAAQNHPRSGHCGTCCAAGPAGAGRRLAQPAVGIPVRRLQRHRWRPPRTVAGRLVAVHAGHARPHQTDVGRAAPMGPRRAGAPAGKPAAPCNRRRAAVCRAAAVRAPSTPARPAGCPLRCNCRHAVLRAASGTDRIRHLPRSPPAAAGGLPVIGRIAVPHATGRHATTGQGPPMAGGGTAGFGLRRQGNRARAALGDGAVPGPALPRQPTQHCPMPVAGLRSRRSAGRRGLVGAALPTLVRLQPAAA